MAHTDNVIGFWDLDSDSADDSGNGHAGTDTSISYNGTYASFGGSSYIDLGNSSALDPTGNRTISLWFNTTNISARQMLFSRDDNTLGRSFFLAINNGGSPLQNYFIDILGTSSDAQQAQTIVSGTFMHVVAVYDQVRTYIYANTVLANGSTRSGTTSSSTGSTIIGGRTYSGFEDRLTGAVRCVALYSEAKDSTWVAADYNSGTPQKWADWNPGGGGGSVFRRTLFNRAGSRCAA